MAREITSRAIAVDHVKSCFYLEFHVDNVSIARWAFDDVTAE